MGWKSNETFGRNQPERSHSVTHITESYIRIDQGSRLCDHGGSDDKIHNMQKNNVNNY